MSDIVNELGTTPPTGVRIGTVERNTTETKISLRLNIDGQGATPSPPASASSTTCWSSFTRHGGFDSNLKCVGDLDVSTSTTPSKTSASPSVKPFADGLGEVRKVFSGQVISSRAMDETLAVCAVDLLRCVAYVFDTR